MLSRYLKASLLAILVGVASPLFAQDMPVNTQKITSVGVVNGKAVSLAKPAYPQAARDAGIGGAVSVQVTIDEAGNVVWAHAMSGHPLLAEVCEASALQSKFKPTLLDGVPVKVTGTVVYNFMPPKELSESEKAFKVFLLAVGVNAAPITSNNTNGAWANELNARYPTLIKEVEALDSVQNAPADKRFFVTIEEINNKLEGNIPGGQIWHFTLGKRLGDLMTRVARYAGTGRKPMDMTPVRTLLIDVREQLKSAPEDFPAGIVTEFNKVANLADSEELLSPRGMDLVGPALVPLYQAIHAGPARGPQ